MCSSDLFAIPEKVIELMIRKISISLGALLEYSAEKGISPGDSCKMLINQLNTILKFANQHDRVLMSDKVIQLMKVSSKTEEKFAELDSFQKKKEIQQPSLTQKI